MEFQMLTVGFQ